MYASIVAIGMMVVTVSVAYGFGSYSIENYPLTKGYDPEFLKQPIVKQTCEEAHEDLAKVGLPDLGYCDKSLGTL